MKNEYKNINSIVYWMEVSINLFFPLIYFAPPPKVKSWISEFVGGAKFSQFQIGGGAGIHKHFAPINDKNLGKGGWPVTLIKKRKYTGIMMI
jgi:hypothetical protein